MKQKISCCRANWFTSVIVQNEEDSSKNIRLAVFNAQFLKLAKLDKLASKSSLCYCGSNI